MSIIEILSAIFVNIGQTNKPLLDFFTELVELKFSIHGRHNFANYARYSKHDESTFRRRFGQYFDWLKFNYATMVMGNVVENNEPVIAAIDCSFISKSGKKTYGIDNFWSGCFQQSKKGLEISVLALICNVCNGQIQTLDVSQTSSGLSQKEGDSTYSRVNFYIEQILDCLVYLSLWKKAGNDEKYDYLELYHHICFSPSFNRWLNVVLIYNTKTKQYALLASTDLAQSAQQILSYYQLRFQIAFLFRDAKQFMGLTHCQAQDEAKLDFHFNLCFSTLNLLSVQKVLEPNALSINNLTRRSYNERFLNNLLTQLSKKADLKVLFDPIKDLFNSVAKWGEMNTVIE